jgi:hypothetical protein
MLADAEEVDAKRIGQHSLLDDVADHLWVRGRFAIRCPGDVSKGVKAEFELLCHGTLPVAVPGSVEPGFYANVSFGATQSRGNEFPRSLYLVCARLIAHS